MKSGQPHINQESKKNGLLSENKKNNEVTSSSRIIYAVGSTIQTKKIKSFGMRLHSYFFNPPPTNLFLEKMITKDDVIASFNADVLTYFETEKEAYEYQHRQSKMNEKNDAYIAMPCRFKVEIQLTNNKEFIVRKILNATIFRDPYNFELDRNVSKENYYINKSNYKSDFASGFMNKINIKRSLEKKEKNKSIHAKRALETIHQGNGIVKVISCGQNNAYHNIVQKYTGPSDTNHWDFILDQLADPEHVRPIRHPEQVYHTEKTRWNPKTRQIEEVNNPNKRGAPKKTVLTKKTSVSSLLLNGVTYLFSQAEDSVGILFDLEILKSLHKQYNKDPEKYVFNIDAVTCCWWKDKEKVQESKKSSLWCSVSFDSLRAREEGSGYDEILLRLSKFAMIGIVATQDSLTGRLSALHKKYYTMKKIQIDGAPLDLPILIIDSKHPVWVYDEKKQEKDLLDGLKTGNPFSHLIQELINDHGEDNLFVSGLLPCKKI